jgi:hypothetical protein
LIVFAVVVFLLIDGAILFLVFRSRRTADDYGKIPVPGQTDVALPAGKARLSYQARAPHSTPGPAGAAPSSAPSR